MAPDVSAQLARAVQRGRRLLALGLGACASALVGGCLSGLDSALALAGGALAALVVGAVVLRASESGHASEPAGCGAACESCSATGTGCAERLSAELAERIALLDASWIRMAASRSVGGLALCAGAVAVGVGLAMAFGSRGAVALVAAAGAAGIAAVAGALWSLQHPFAAR